MFGFSATAPQLRTLADLIEAMGTGLIDAAGNPKSEGPIVLTVDEHEYIVTQDGDLLDPERLAA